MTTSRVLKFLLMFACCSLLRPADSDSYWLIVRKLGTWRYRVGGGEGKALTGKYDCLRQEGEVQCLESDLQRCRLYYLTEDTEGPAELPVKLVRTGRWVPLKDLTPPKSLSIPTPLALVDKFEKIAQPGGSRDSSACGGDFVLRSPVCGETIDISDFRLQWSEASSDQTKRVSVLVERVDGPPALYRAAAPMAKGEYAEDKLLDFLKKQQGRNDVVDVTVRVIADSGRSAIRLVHIPPSARTERYEARVRGIETDNPFLRSVQLISLAADEGMWSRAANEARQLMELTPGAALVAEYALAGLCRSNFEEEKARLRGELPEGMYEEVCGPTRAAGARPATPASAVSPPPRTDRRGEGVAPRLGIALLIGNSDYWNLPLNSVKSDVRSLDEALTGLGFQVTVRQNLRNPAEFQEALRDFLRKSDASPDDILLVYYSGHGLQLDGKAHLLGTGFLSTARVAEDVRSNAQSAEDLLSEMERAAPGTRILIVEACRNNIFASSSTLGGQNPRAGFAFQQDDVPNTFVMFADKPGALTPARSDYGLMGPFTESMIYALRNSSGEIHEVFSLTQQKTNEMNKDQQPVLYTSKRADRVVLRQQEERKQVNRAADLLNSAEILYRNKAWDRFFVTVDRAGHLAADAGLQERLNKEVAFVGLVITAEKREEIRDWKEAAISWQRASQIFPSRQWVAMKAGVAWLMADDLREAVRVLAALNASGDGDPARQAGSILPELLKAFPELEADARSAAQAACKPPAQEFELVDIKE